MRFFSSRLLQQLAVAAALVMPTLVHAQHGVAPPIPSAPQEASQFDFLVGQWEVVAKPKASGMAERIHGAPKLPGVWKAWRGLDGWGIEDELRLSDSSGNPLLVQHSLRIWDPKAQQWSLSSLNVYRSTFTSGTAVWRDGEMQVTSRATDSQGREFLARTRFLDIKADGFRMQQDRSFDDGKTWTEKALTIDAKRVAAVAPR